MALPTDTSSSCVASARATLVVACVLALLGLCGVCNHMGTVVDSAWGGALDMTPSSASRSPRPEVGARTHTHLRYARMSRPHVFSQSPETVGHASPVVSPPTAKPGSQLSQRKLLAWREAPAEPASVNDHNANHAPQASGLRTLVGECTLGEAECESAVARALEAARRTRDHGVAASSLARRRATGDRPQHVAGRWSVVHDRHGFQPHRAEATSWTKGLAAQAWQAVVDDLGTDVGLGDKPASYALRLLVFHLRTQLSVLARRSRGESDWNPHALDLDGIRSA